MPISQLDPIAALVAIDLQKGVLGLPTIHPIPEILGNTARLAVAFRAAGLPVVYVNVTARPPGRAQRRFEFSPPPDWHELAPELGAEPADIRVTKLGVSAFHGTGLDVQLRRHGVTQVFFAGLTTSSGVEATARSAYDHGYNVVCVSDAMTDTDAESHDHAIAKQLPKFAEIATTDELLAALTKS